MKFSQTVTAALLAGQCATAYPNAALDTYNVQHYDNLMRSHVQVESGTDAVKALTRKIYPNLTEAQATTAFKVSTGALAIIGYYSQIDDGRQLDRAIDSCSDPQGYSGTLKCVNDALVSLAGFAFYGFLGYHGGQTVIATLAGMNGLQLWQGNGAPPNPAVSDTRQLAAFCPNPNKYGSEPESFTTAGVGVKLTATNDCNRSISQDDLNGWESLLLGMLQDMQQNGAWAVQASFCTANSGDETYSIEIHSSIEVTANVNTCEDPVSGQGVCTASYN